MKPTIPQFSIIAAGLLCSACTLGPDYHAPQAPEQLPAHYQAVDPATVTETGGRHDWWLIFDDPAIGPLVQLALERNLDLAGADASIRQARAAYQIVDSASALQLNADGRVGRDQFSKHSENFANIPFANPQTGFTDYRGGFDASWELDLFGRTRRSTEAARAEVEASTYLRQEVALRVTAEVVRNVIEYRAWQQRLVAQGQIAADGRAMLDLTVLQQRAGLLAEPDLRAAESSLHQAEAALPPVQAASSAALQALAVLTAQSESSVQQTLAGPTGIPQVPKLLHGTGLPSDLLLRRPDLRAAERQLAAANAEIGVAMADQYPHLDLLGSTGLDAIHPGQFASLASRYWNVGPQLSIPLLSGKRLQAQVEANEAARDAALAQYRGAVLTAFADAETSLIRYQREQQRQAELMQALQSQQSQLKLAEQHYQTGDNNYSVVLQARQQLELLHDQQLASQQALAEDLVALYKALGGAPDNTAQPA